MRRLCAARVPPGSRSYGSGAAQDPPRIRPRAAQVCAAHVPAADLPVLYLLWVSLWGSGATSPSGWRRRRGGTCGFDGAPRSASARARSRLRASVWPVARAAGLAWMSPTPGHQFVCMMPLFSNTMGRHRAILRFHLWGGPRSGREVHDHPRSSCGAHPGQFEQTRALVERSFSEVGRLRAELRRIRLTPHRGADGPPQGRSW